MPSGEVGGLIGAEEHGLVEGRADSLGQTRTDVRPDVVIGIVQHVLRNGNDTGDFLRIQLDVFPRLRGGLLIAGVAIHPVRHREAGKDRQHAGLGGHIRQTAHQLHRHGLFRYMLEDFSRIFFRDEDIRASTVNDRHSSIPPIVCFVVLLRPASGHTNGGVGIGAGRLFLAALIAERTAKAEIPMLAARIGKQVAVGLLDFFDLLIEADELAVLLADAVHLEQWHHHIGVPHVHAAQGHP